MALVHALCVVVMIFGPVLGWRKPVWRAAHLFLLFVTAAAWSFYCPLSVVENVLRSRFDPSVGYQRGFLEHLNPLLHLNAYRDLLAWAIRGWFVLWAVIYGILWAREARGGKATLLKS